MKIRLLVVCLFGAISLSAQDFQGKAVYKTHRKMDIQLDSTSNINSDSQKQIQEMIMKQFQKTFTLTFDTSESLYKEKESLSTPQPQSNMQIMVVGNGGGSDVLYKNIKENRFANKSEVMGKRFLIKGALEKFDWKLTGETKNIGTYTCYKATFSKEVENTSMNSINGEIKEVKTKKELITTAWYTPEIPVSHGPQNFGGLPGLILEINEGKLTIACTEIVLNPEEKIKIEEPTKGKVVSQKKFDEIMNKKSKEMMERFRSRKKDGADIEIRISG